jgi:hypothetical protein
MERFLSKLIVSCSSCFFVVTCFCNSSSCFIIMAIFVSTSATVASSAAETFCSASAAASCAAAAAASFSFSAAASSMALICSSTLALCLRNVSDGRGWANIPFGTMCRVRGVLGGRYCMPRTVVPYRVWVWERHGPRCVSGVQPRYCKFSKVTREPHVNKILYRSRPFR